MPIHMQVLSTKNIELLKLIARQKPQSIQELSEMSGRKKSNLSRTLKTFQGHRLIDIVKEHRRKRPVALATEFDIQIGRELPSFLCDEFLNGEEGIACRR